MIDTGMYYGDNDWMSEEHSTGVRIIMLKTYFFYFFGYGIDIGVKNVSYRRRLWPHNVKMV